MTTPHPTPEERYEAAHEKAALEHFDRKERRDVPSVFIDRIRPEMITAIREAEAAAEARGRAMERERVKNSLDLWLNDHLVEMREGYDDSVCGFNEAWDVVRECFRSYDEREAARTNKDSSDV